MKQKVVDNVHADELDMRDELDTRPTPLEELEPVQLDDELEHLAYIGSKLVEDVRDPLIYFLKQNVEVFAWKQEDMGGIDIAVITHKLNVNPSFKPFKQERRSFASERQKAINEEVSKLLQAQAIREVDYPTGWLTWFSSKRQTENGGSALTLLTSIEPARKIVFPYLGLTL